MRTLVAGRHTTQHRRRTCNHRRRLIIPRCRPCPSRKKRRLQLPTIQNDAGKITLHFNSVVYVLLLLLLGWNGNCLSVQYFVLLLSFETYSNPMQVTTWAPFLVLYETGQPRFIYLIIVLFLLQNVSLSLFDILNVAFGFEK